MDDCIFCKIAAGEIPSTVVYENDRAIAIEDLNPQAPVHVLVMPKTHHANILDGVEADELAALVEAIGEVAKAKGLEERGFRVIANTGADAGQTVDHLHVHVLGGRELGEGLLA